MDQPNNLVCEEDVRATFVHEPLLISFSETHCFSQFLVKIRVFSSENIKFFFVVADPTLLATFAQLRSQPAGSLGLTPSIGGKFTMASI